MNEEIYADIAARLDAMAAELGIVGEHLWEVLVTQQAIEAWACVLGLVPLWLAASLMPVWPIVQYRRGCDSLTREASYGGRELSARGIVALMFSIVSVVAAVFAIAATIHDLPTIMTGFFNPEFGALHEILETLQ